ncbi:MAG: DUF465 domain-containing protein [Rickettsiales bacterium]|nr:DUF465 domain-containing protein [Rickettsiales bacterium]
MDDELFLHKELEGLRQEHKALDARLSDVPENGHINFEAARLKKEKLRLKDRIAKIEQTLYPDIIA